MSALPDTRAVSISSAGYEDGLGRRSVRFDREVGGMLECLHLRPELWAFESHLRSSANAIVSLDDERFARVRAVERTAHGLVVISELVHGQRLVDIIEVRQRDDPGAFGIDAAIGFLLQALPALSTLHTLALAHGALAPERIVVTNTSQIVLLDSIYAVALERLNLSRYAMWSTLGILAPPFVGAPRFDRQMDLTQAALCALVVAVGRPLEGSGDPSSLGPLVSELREVAEIRAGVDFAFRVQQFFTTLLPVSGRRPAVTADQAAIELERLADTIGEEGCHYAFTQLTRLEPTIARPRAAESEEEDFEEPDTPAIVSVEEEEPRRAAAQSTRSPVAGPPAPTFTPVVLPPPVVAVSSIPAHAVPEPAATPFTPVVPPPTVLPVSPPVLTQPVPEPAAPAFIPAAPPPVAVSQAISPTVVSTPTPPVPIPPAPVVTEPLVDVPAPVSYAPPPVALPVPIAPPPVPPVSFAAPAPAAPAPAAVVAPPRVSPFVPPPVQAAPAIQPAPAPISVVASPPATLRVRVEPPGGYAPVRPDPDASARALPFVDRATAEVPARFPWKLVAAAVIVLAVGIAAGRAYIAGEPKPTPMFEEPPKPVAAAGVPTGGTTGSLAIDTQPTGAKITLDGVDVGVAPLKLDSVAPGKHVVVVSTANATIRRTVRVEAGRQITLDVPVYSGWVSVFSPIPLDIAAGGQTLGNTDTGKIILPPGRHVLTLSNREFGFSETRAVEVLPGEERPVNIEPKGRVNVNAHPWAEVWIDGKKAGDTPIANLPVLMGTRVFTFKHPQYGERRVTVTVTSTSDAVSVDFTKS